MGESATLRSSHWSHSKDQSLHFAFVFINLYFNFCYAFHHLLYHRHCVYIFVLHCCTESLRQVWNININGTQTCRCTISMFFHYGRSKGTSAGVPVCVQGWFWGEEMCCSLNAGCWLTLSPTWIQRCRLASAEKYSVCAHAGVCVCVLFSSVAAACLPPHFLSQLFISMPPLISLALPRRPKWALSLKNVKSIPVIADGAWSFSSSHNLFFFVFLYLFFVAGLTYGFAYLLKHFVFICVVDGQCIKPSRL